MTGPGSDGTAEPVIAIDGPAGAGKSTVARSVAARLGFTYVDTGALYRALALAAIEDGVPPHDAAALAAVAERADIRLQGDRVFLEDRDVTGRIRAADVTAGASTIAAHPAVRRSMLARQRALAAAGGVVMEGRDIGSAVVPDADVKVFLTASLKERARRRWAEEPSTHTSLDEVIATIDARDRSDSTRRASPLVRAPDATLIDSTDRSIDEVVDAIVALVEGDGAA